MSGARRYLFRVQDEHLAGELFYSASDYDAAREALREHIEHIDSLRAEREAVLAALEGLRRKDVSGEPRMELSTDWFNSGVSAAIAAVNAIYERNRIRRKRGR